MSMRIIAGIGKGRKLFSPPSITRPTSDRAREGLFSSLISTFGTLEGLHFLDLFAGSAAVGVEALSRGAALVEAVESNSVSADVCEENFALLSSLTGVGKFKIIASLIAGSKLISSPIIKLKSSSSRSRSSSLLDLLPRLPADLFAVIS